MLKPLKNKVIIDVEKNNVTEGGIVISSNLETDSLIGKVVSVSDNCFDVLNIGTRCIVSKFAGNKVQYDRKEYLVVDIDNILAIVEEE